MKSLQIKKKKKLYMSVFKSAELIKSKRHLTVSGCMCVQKQGCEYKEVEKQFRIVASTAGADIGGFRTQRFVSLELAA